MRPMYRGAAVIHVLYYERCHIGGRHRPIHLFMHVHAEFGAPEQFGAAVDVDAVVINRIQSISQM